MKQEYVYTAIVKRVVDGDTIDLDIDLGFSVWLKKQRFRLYGINAPESRTRDLEEKARGIRATEHLRYLCPVGSTVTVKTIENEKGKFGRWLAEIYIDGDERSVNEILVEEGLAVVEFY